MQNLCDGVEGNLIFDLSKELIDWNMFTIQKQTQFILDCQGVSQQRMIL